MSDEITTVIRYWYKTKKGVKYITDNPSSERPTVFGDLAKLIYEHCKTQKRGVKGSLAREIKVTISS